MMVSATAWGGFIPKIMQDSDLFLVPLLSQMHFNPFLF
jgi:hypothetical protein